jgi:predicted AlkP superfamily pyrophosphatase or phosphodiesterase
MCNRFCRRARAPFLVMAGLALSALVLGTPAPAQAARPAPLLPERPRLIVLIVVDQMRGDYVNRFREELGTGGFLRLAREGADFANAHYPYAATQTCAGHATVATGSTPSMHGMIGNFWRDRATGKPVTCVEDPASPILGGGGKGGASPHFMRTSTLGDELVMALGSARSRVVAVSVKDRSAITLGGRLGAAYWWNESAGGFTTSQFYRSELPAWLVSHNVTKPLERFRGAVWDRALPEARYRRLGPDDVAFEKSMPFLGRTFPHKMPGAGASDADLARAVIESPFGNQLVVDVARAALSGEGLGQPGHTDLLALSLSSTDIVGHDFGPDSHEVLDALVRTDRMIADLLADIDRKVGLANTVVALTADHGVAMVPEAATARKFPAGRINPDDLVKAAKTALDAQFGADDWVTGFAVPGLFLNRARLLTRKVPLEQAERVAAAALHSHPGVAFTFTHEDLARGIAGGGQVGRAVLEGFDPERSGDVIVVQRPYYYLYMRPDGDATMHGTPYAYDTHVPLYVRGPGVKPGQRARAVSPAELAPTLAYLLRIAAPSGSTGSLLYEMIEEVR